MAILEIKNIDKSFDGQILILNDISLSIDKGSSVAIVGKSGTGKSTLLHIAGLLEKPSKGTVIVNSKDTAELSDRELSAMRNRNIGFVFQSHMLLEDFTVLENVMVPALINGAKKDEVQSRALELLEKVGLGEFKDRYPSSLSGGEKQRTAICRALINKPDIILADEPTGSLDEDNAQSCENLFFDLVKEENTSLLLVTHNKDFALKCDKVFEIKNHKLNKVGK